MVYILCVSVYVQGGGREIRATLPAADLDDLHRLPGVTTVQRRGEGVALRCADSDLALRALLARYPAARDIEVSGAGLEEAFLALTGTGAPITSTITRTSTSTDSEVNV